MSVIALLSVEFDQILFSPDLILTRSYSHPILFSPDLILTRSYSHPILFSPDLILTRSYSHPGFTIYDLYKSLPGGECPKTTDTRVRQPLSKIAHLGSAAATANRK